MTAPATTRSDVTGEPRGGLRPRGWSWLLPLLLTCAPLLPLWREAANSQVRTDAEVERLWLEATEEAARTVAATSDIGHWAGLATRRLARRLEAAYRQLGGAGGPGAAWGRLDHRPLVRGMAPPMVVLLSCDWPGARPTVCRGPGLEAGKGVLWREFLGEMCAPGYRGLSDEDWSEKLKGYFGAGASADFFRESSRGRAFPAKIGEQRGYCAWDYLFAGARRVGLVLCFFVRDDDRPDLPMQLALAEWRRDARVFPAYLPLPPIFPGGTARSGLMNGAGPAGGRPSPVAVSANRAWPGQPLDPWLGFGAEKARLHPALRSRRSAVRWITSTWRRLRVTPASSPAGLGRVRLAAEELGTIVRGPGWWGRWVPLADVSDSIGFLVGRAPGRVVAPLVWIARLWTGMLGIGWLLIAVRVGLGGGLPSPGLRNELLLWLLGLLALPAVLGVGASIRLLDTVEANLLDQLERELEQPLRQLEAGDAQLKADQLINCRRLVRDAALEPVWQRLAAHPPPSKAEAAACVARLWQTACGSLSLPLSALIVFNGSSEPIAGSFSGMPRPSQKVIEQIGGNFVKLDLELAGLYRPSTGTTGGFSTADVTAVQNSLGRARTHTTTGDRVEGLWFGQERLMTYHAAIPRRPVPLAVLLIWNQGPAWRKYLDRQIDRCRLAFSRFDIGIFRPVGHRMVAVKGTRHDRILVEYARAAQTGRKVWGRHEGRLLAGGWFGTGLQKPGDRRLAASMIVARPGRVPGYVLVVRGSLVGVWAILNREGNRLLVMALASLLLAMCAAARLSERLGTPLTEMARGLGRVAAGDLGVELATDAGDELGETAHRLAEMTGALRERQALTRFVAPQVLEVVGGGDASRLAMATRREVVVLVSDVRDFTSLAETCPPQPLFAALNAHLAGSAAAIQRHQGVIDRFLGDAVVAVFYPSASGESAARRAVAAAGAIMRQSHLRSRSEVRDGEPHFAIGVGLDTGEVVAGVLGNPEVRLDYSVLGEAVQGAARMEALSKLGTATRIVVSDAVRGQLGDGVRCRRLPDRGQVGPDAAVEAAWELESTELEPEGGSGNRIPVVSDRADPPLGAPAPDRSQVVAPGIAVSSRATGPDLRSVRATPDDRADYADRRDRRPPGHQPRAGWLWRAAVAGALWLLPAFVAGVAVQFWCEGLEDGRQLEVSSRLAADLAWVEQAADPGQQLQLLIKNGLAHLPAHRHGEVAGSGEVAAELAAAAALMCKLQIEVPELTWWLWAPASAAHDGRQCNGADRHEVGSAPLPPWKAARNTSFAQCNGAVPVTHPADLAGTIVASGGFEPLWTTGDMVALAERAMEVLPIGMGVGTDATPIPFECAPGGLASSLPALVPSALGALHDLRIGPAGRMLMVEPVWSRSGLQRWRQYEEAGGWDEGTAEGRPDLTGDLRGFAIVSVNPARLRADRTMLRWAAANLAREGARLLVWPSGPTDRQRLARLQRSLGGASAGQARSALARCRHASGTISLDRRYTLVVLRPMADPAPIEMLVRQLRLPAMLVWGLLGLGLWWQGHRRSGGRRLSSFLVGMFVLVLAPGLLLALLLLERNHVDAFTRAEVDERERLLTRLDRFEAGLRLYETYDCRVLDRWLRRPGRLAGLHRAVARDFDVPYPAPRASLAWVNDQIGLLRRYGLLINHIIIGNGTGQGVAYPPRVNKREYETQKVMHRLMGEFFGRLNSRARGPGGSSAADEAMALAMGSEVDKFMSLTSFWLGPKVAAQMHTFRRYLGAQFLAGEQSPERFYQQGHFPPAAGSRPYPGYFMRAMWQSDGYLQHQLAAFADVAENDPLNRIRFRFSPRKQPSWVLGAPFFELHYQPGLKCWQLTARHRLQGPERSALAARAMMANAPMSGRFGAGARQSLVVARPGTAMHHLVAGIESDLGARLAGQAAQLWQQRWGLLGLIVFAAGLALQVASRFLAPVLATAAASQRIAAGERGVRLPPLAGHSETAGLIRSFNAVAEGVDEGRLLGRFVAEVARSSARDSARQSAARLGEAQEVVAMFVALTGFKERLTRDDPADLVRGLNVALQRLSFLVHRAGGEVDKFIGDKLLAVFRADDLGGLGPAVTAAVGAAESIRRAIPGPGWAAAPPGARPLPLPPSIGMVAGPVLAGILGSPDVRLEYTVIGDTVNLSSRLCDIGAGLEGGGVVLDGTVATQLTFNRDAGRLARLRRLEVSQVKGKLRRVEIHHLLDR